MKIAANVNKILAAVFFGLVLLLVMPATSMAQGRGRGHGRGQNWDKNWDKKCGKFVNCHDARDGRVDGRGPRRSSYNRRNWNWGNRVGYRNRRYNTNDYWQRRHLTNGRTFDMNRRYRNYRRPY